MQKDIVIVLIIFLLLAFMSVFAYLIHYFGSCFVRHSLRRTTPSPASEAASSSSSSSGSRRRQRRRRRRKCGRRSWGSGGKEDEETEVVVRGMYTPTSPTPFRINKTGGLPHVHAKPS
ncbi:predicted protein [Histoplasma capsulatum G186AR]|uniref:Uncharacterized protein n=1 Tax=Ajellomyces capsulatus (strain G186AR / H82 / ATCC MYA-2454 / RMSCC 2432) TaxID=447093 RepID=C0NXH5_AJECG|nr:uncharacterized protein HCBG_08167 [Histoplasma capsulatum G186AR]EEH04041.1 predicted protein [Histoplasma capsulatum G186AR]